MAAGLLISIYSVGGGIAQAPLGILSDRYDRLYILPTGIVIAALVSHICSFTNDR
ncbi:hypothetical protein D8S78_22660 [Natrialba swarupiae]|nr:hypothetical protein [Natrialba swarupiae]